MSTSFYNAVGRTVILTLAGLLCCHIAIADEVSPARTGILWLDWATDQVAFTLREAAPPEPIDPGMSPSADPLAATHSIESIEIYRLQQEIRMLRQLIEDNLLTRVMTMEGELRDVKVALQGRQTPGYSAGPVIPRPDSDETPLPESSPSDRNRMPAPDAAEPSLPPSAPFAFTVLGEWGRSPEVVQELGSDASTLIGLVGVVPARSRKADVVSLAQELRRQYDVYDNISIEVFDTEAAAQAYLDQQTIDARHHVASISRHRASGRDLVLYLGDEIAEPISVGGVPASE